MLHRQNDARRPVSRVLSAPVLGAGRPFLWDAPRGAPHATNPDGEAGMPPGIPRTLAGAAVPIWSCSRWGLPCRPRCRRRGALLPHRFALARGVSQRMPPTDAPRRMSRRAPWGPCAGGLFSVALSLGSPPPAVGRHRIPVEPGLSSVPLRGQRPSGRLARGEMRGGGERVKRHDGSVARGFRCAVGAHERSVAVRRARSRGQQRSSPGCHSASQLKRLLLAGSSLSGSGPSTRRSGDERLTSASAATAFFCESLLEMAFRMANDPPIA
jgi:hypothetical protein